MIGIRDPIHGFIYLSPLEIKIVNSPFFQRMRYIKQLGLTYLVFPGAEHTRFSHMLGTLHLASRVYDSLSEKFPDILPPNGREKDLLRLAALLHDLGHTPFSHSGEFLFSHELDHEKMTVRIIQSPYLANILSDYKVNVDDLVSLIKGEGCEVTKLLAQILDGEVDVDKMDYLIRDSMYCGVQYGCFDLEKSIDSFTILQENDLQLGMDKGGIHLLESVILARYYMFSQVYFDPKCKAFELHLQNWLLQEIGPWPSEVEEFLELDDYCLTVKMRKSKNIHARAIVDRTPFPLVFSTAEHLTDDEYEHFLELFKEANCKFDGMLLLSNSTKEPHNLKRTNFPVIDTDGIVKDAKKISKFVSYMEKINCFRVYAPQNLVEEVKKFFTSRWFKLVNV